MANTGYKWPTQWVTLQNAVVLTQGGTIVDTSDAVSLDVKASCEISITATYSDHALATAGLTVAILRDIDGTNYETVAVSLPWGFEMPFNQNNTVRRTITISGADISNFKVYLSWGNTTGSSSVTVTTRYKTSDIPVAS